MNHSPLFPGTIGAKQVEFCQAKCFTDTNTRADLGALECAPCPL